VSESPGFTK